MGFLSCRRNQSVLFVSVLAFFLVAVVPVSALYWVCETVDSGNNYGAGSSLKLDSAGNPRISYMQTSGTGGDYWSVRYAEKDEGSAWVQTTVDPATGSSDWFHHATSLALDNAGNPRISYHNHTSKDLWYAARNGGVWSATVADPNNPYHGYNDRGEYPSLALDSAGNPHISYQDAGFGVLPQLKYAWWNGVSWENQTTPHGYYTATWDTSLALDGSGVAHMASTNSSSLLYFTFNGATWTTETVDNSDNDIRYISLALDTAGNPRISYYGVEHNVLKYAEKNAGFWTNETVVSSGGYNSLALDSTGHPHIGFENGGDLQYASKTGSSWTIETVDNSTMVYHPSLAIDSRDLPHISYWDYTNGILKYAVGVAPATIGVYRNSTHRFYLDKTGNGAWGSGDVWYSFGNAGDLPVTGDWNGIGKEWIGVYRPSTHRFYLDTTGNGAWGSGDYTTSFGNTGDLPVIGDWSKDGFADIGVYRPSTHRFYLDKSMNGMWDAGDLSYSFGSTGDLPVAGHWNHDITSAIGVYRPSTHRFYLDSDGDGAWDSGDKTYSFGNTGDLPVAGDWNGDSITEIGVYRPSTHKFYLDKSGNGKWGSGDVSCSFGNSGDSPVAGLWG